jgi:ribosomal-protein-alanine N-acetyltransferase
MAIETAGNQKHPWTRAMVLDELNHEHGFHFGIKTLNSIELCSYLLCRLFLEELHVLHLCTLPLFRRKGLATALLEHAFSVARPAGGKIALLEVASSNNAATDLYSGLDFTLDFTRKKYYADGDDALVMSRIL